MRRYNRATLKRRTPPVKKGKGKGTRGSRGTTENSLAGGDEEYMEGEDEADDDDDEDGEPRKAKRNASGDLIYPLARLLNKTKSNFMQALSEAVTGAWARCAFATYPLGEDDSGKAAKPWNKKQIAAYWMQGRGWNKTHPCRMGLRAGALAFRQRVQLVGTGTTDTYCGVGKVFFTRSQMAYVWSRVRFILICVRAGTRGERDARTHLSSVWLGPYRQYRVLS